MSLILKRASASRPSGSWSEDDFDVLADGKVIGRILEEGSRFAPPELRWFWSITEMGAVSQRSAPGERSARVRLTSASQDIF
jgi:hypothetical protein